MKKIIHIWMRWEDMAFLYYLLYLPLYSSSILYGICIKLRYFLYHIGIFKTKRLTCKVISIGNITVGGSGKTPMAIYLAKKLQEKSRKVVILSRGYKGKVKGIGVVSDGMNILLDPEDAGDEPYLMAAKLKNIPVIVGKDRYKAGLYAIEKFNPDIIILDDGFQHIGLARDVDILLIDSRRGFGKGHLFPMGILREPLSGLKRASLVVLKNGEWGVGCGKWENLFLPSTAHHLPPIFFSYKPQAMINLITGERLSVGFLKDKRIIALSGIADPISFKGTLEGLGAVIVKEISYPDHYCYTPDDLNYIMSEAKGTNIMVVTEKDGVKLKRLSIKSLAIYALEIDVEIRDTDSEIFFAKVVGL